MTKLLIESNCGNLSYTIIQSELDQLLRCWIQVLEDSIEKNGRCDMCLAMLMAGLFFVCPCRLMIQGQFSTVFEWKNDGLMISLAGENYVLCLAI